MENEKVLMLLGHYIDEYLKLPDGNPKNNIFFVLSYSRWAAYEVYERIANETMILPCNVSGKEQVSAIDIIENFIDEMQELSEIKIETSYIFEIAKETAIDILQVIFGERSKHEQN